MGRKPNPNKQPKVSTGQGRGGARPGAGRKSKNGPSEGGARKSRPVRLPPAIWAEIDLLATNEPGGNSNATAETLIREALAARGITVAAGSIAGRIVAVELPARVDPVREAAEAVILEHKAGTVELDAAAIMAGEPGVVEHAPEYPALVEEPVAAEDGAAIDPNAAHLAAADRAFAATAEAKADEAAERRAKDAARKREQRARAKAAAAGNVQS